MPRENTNNKIWKYYKRGDIIIDEDGETWGLKKFEINSFHGNAYLPLVSAHFLGKPRRNKFMCNFDARRIKLMNAPKRPFKTVAQPALLKMMSKGIVEAKREVLIRINQKKFKNV